MRCPSAKRLAAASLGADPKALLHADTCEPCGAELAAMAELGAFARRAPVRVASAERRARIAALVMATSDATVVKGKSRAAIAIAVAGIAATLALIAWRAAPVERTVAYPVLPHLDPIAVAPDPVTAPIAAPVVRLEPAVEVAPPVAPRPAPRHAASPPATRVFGGSEERAHDDALARDQVALAPAVNEPLAAFQTGWAALREARYADAIAAFDRAKDPAVAEDAAYWAAIATARAGDRAGATRRLRDFLVAFPGTARRAEASELLTRLAQSSSR